MLLQAIHPSVPMRALTSLLTVFIASFVLWLGSVIYTDFSPFDGDEADHANPALELFHDVRSGDPGGAYGAIVKQSFYPPINSIAVAASYLVLSPSPFSTRLPSLIFFTLSIITLALTTRRFLGNIPSAYPLAGSLLVALLAALSPIAVYNGVLCMLEPLNILFISLLLYVFTGFDRVYASRTGLVLLVATLSVLILLEKYSSGIPLLAAIGTTALGLTLQKRLSIRELLLLGGVISIAIGTWAFIGNQTCMVAYVADQPSYKQGVFSFENFLFEPTAFFTDHVAHPIIGVLAVGLALVAVVTWHRTAVVQLSVAIIFWGWFVMFLSTNNGSRHTMFLTPPIWFLAGAGFSQLLTKAATRWKHLPVSGLAPWILSFLIIMLTVPWLQGLPLVLSKRFEANPFQYYLTERVLDRLSPSVPALVRGFNDAYSLEYIRWAAARRWNVPYSEIKIDGFPLDVSLMQRCRRTISPLIDKLSGRITLDRALTDGYYPLFIQLVAGPQTSESPNARLAPRAYRTWCALGYNAHDLTAPIWAETPLVSAQPEWCQRKTRVAKSAQDSSTPHISTD